MTLYLYIKVPWRSTLHPSEGSPLWIQPHLIPIRPLNLQLKSAVRCGCGQKHLQQGGRSTLHVHNAAIFFPHRPCPIAKWLSVTAIAIWYFWAFFRVKNSAISSQYMCLVCLLAKKFCNLQNPTGIQSSIYKQTRHNIYTVVTQKSAHSLLLAQFLA